MENFTPLASTIGGALIGVAAVMLMAMNGRIAGISGIFSSAIFSGSDRWWRLLFVAGLVAGPLVYTLVMSEAPAFQLDAGWPALIAGGLLVGFGTRLGSGCTSGHGVCGLARFSVRSLVSVLLFMGAGIATVTIIRLTMGG